MPVAEKVNLADARAELRVSQDALAKEARLAKSVIIRAERGHAIQRSSGHAIQRSSAHAIVRALNHFREQAEMPAFSFPDFDWKIHSR